MDRSRATQGPSGAAWASTERSVTAPWYQVLRALREARGSTVEGWGARLGVSGKTVQRWERGVRVPDPGAEQALLAACRELGLLRSYDRGPLTGLHLTEEVIRDLLANARWQAHRALPAPLAAAAASSAESSGRADGGRTSVPHYSLPVYLTNFVGRGRELAQLRRVLGGTRLLTLTGAGGSGKTRLALALADELLLAYPHGIWFVDLSPLADPALTPQAVLAVLAIRPGAQSPMDALIQALQEQRRLVILDNCEHLLPACAVLVETLLRACPYLEIVATSRQTLGINGETVWRTPPLTFQGRAPADSATSPLSDGSEVADAVQLFIERARLQRPDLELMPSDVEAIAEICRRLDGMPLAIELAASRVSVLSVDQIAGRLDDRFRLLSGGGPTTPHRHRSLYATMLWSYEMLSDAEQAALRALSVFAGGFPLDAAEVMLDDGPVHLPKPDGNLGRHQPRSPLDRLERLVEHSLVVVEPRGGTLRYRLLETVREFAAAQLVDVHEATRVHGRHGAWCIALAETAQDHRHAPDQAHWLEQLAAELDNLRAALAWSLSEQGDVTIGLRLGAALWWFWDVRGLVSEGRRRLTALLERGGDGPPHLRAQVLNGAAVLAAVQEDFDTAERLLEQSLALRRELGDEAGVAVSLRNLGNVVLRRSGDHIAQARLLYEQSLTIQRKLGNAAEIARCLVNLGTATRMAGDPRQAVACHEEALSLVRATGDALGVAGVLLNLGNAYLDVDQSSDAATCYREGLDLAQTLDAPTLVYHALSGFAAVAAAQGLARRAAVLAGAIARLNIVLGIPSPPDRSHVGKATAFAGCALSGPEFRVAWETGQSLSLEQAVAEALG